MGYMSKITEDLEMCKVIDSIYSNMFCDFREQYIIVFLCGGSSKKGQLSLRDKVRPLLEKSKKYYYQMPIKTFYPEDLLIEELNRNKSADLMTYEQLLADNSHIIAIICESAGALVELGAFTNNEVTVDKVIVAVNKNFEKNKSFVMLGPVKYLRRKGNANFLTYGKNTKDFAAGLAKMIRSKYRDSNITDGLKLDSIVGMNYYIQLLLYFFKSLDKRQLQECVEYTAKTNGVKIKNFRTVFNAALRLLFQEQYVINELFDGQDRCKLSKSGFWSIEKIIKNCQKGYLCDKIRIEIMYSRYYKAPKT